MFLKLSGSVLFVENASFAINSSLLPALKDSCGVDIADLTAGWWWWWEGGGGGIGPSIAGITLFLYQFFRVFFANTRVVTQSKKRQLHLVINSLQMPQPEGKWESYTMHMQIEVYWNRETERKRWNYRWKRFHLNDQSTRFHPRTQKLELHTKQILPCKSAVEEVSFEW